MSNDEVCTTSRTGARKGTKPCRPDLIPAQAWVELATHYGVGAEKYTERDSAGRVTHDGANNWRLGYEWSKSSGALLRHVLAFLGGEDYDSETGSKHVIAAAWHCMALATFMDEFRNFDDRPTTPKSVPDRVNDLTADEAYRHYEWDFGDLRFRYRNGWELTAQSNLKNGPLTVWQTAVGHQTCFSHGEYVRVQ